MFKYLSILLLGFVLVASADTFLTPENHFFGIPNADSLTTRWYRTKTNPPNTGPALPMDVEVLKLSPFDYRMVILSNFSPFLASFRIDPYHGVPNGGVALSGTVADTSIYYPSAMCQMRHGTWFNPTTDRIAVTFWQGQKIGIFSFDKLTGRFFLEQTISIPLPKLVGIFWAFDNFFIVDRESQRIDRFDSQGNYVSGYGHRGLWETGYVWLSDISADADANKAHLYVSDGNLARIDELTTSVTDTTFYLSSQIWVSGGQRGSFAAHDVTLIPQVGLISLDRDAQRLYFWNRTDSLQLATHICQDWGRDSAPLMRVFQLCGRAVLLYPQANAGWTLRSFLISGVTPDDPIPYPTDHWTAEISPVIISGTWHVTNGDTLTIDPDVEVQFESGAGLVVDGGGRLLVEGTSGHGVQFHAAQPSQSWTGIRVDKGGSIVMTYATVSDADSFSLFVDTPKSTSGTPVSLDHCVFDGSKQQQNSDAVRILGDLAYKTIVTNSRIDHVTKGRGLYLYNCIAEFQNDTIQGCDTSNTYLKQVSGVFTGCLFKGRGIGHGILFEGSNCTPNFQCCTFKDLARSDALTPTILALKGTGPTFGWEQSSGGAVSNTFTDSSYALMRFTYDKVMPIIDNVLKEGGPGGKNDWYQRWIGGVYLYCDGATTPPYSAQNQYWNRKVGNGDFYPNGGGLFAFDTIRSTPWGPCGIGSPMAVPGSPHGPVRGGAGLDDLESDLSLFSDGMNAELSENYSDAQSSFHSVIAATNDAELRWQSLTHIVSAQRHLDGETGDTWIPALIDSAMAIDTNAYATHVYGNRLLAAYRTDRAQFSDAISICTDLFSSGLTYDDSLLVAIDLIGIQMLADSGNGGGLDDPHGLGNIPVALRIRSVSHGLSLERQLLNQLGTTHTTGRNPVTVPTTYRLYQNYPNPFNPLTEIRFDIPDAVRVELKIYNTLGQLVTTLCDDVRPAGAYRLTWDGRSSGGLPVASGLYVYQLKAGHFTDAKKMLLMK